VQRGLKPQVSDLRPLTTSKTQLAVLQSGLSFIGIGETLLR